MVIAVIALSVALVGTAVAGPEALTRALTKSKVKKVARKQANKVLDERESALNVNSAATAQSLDGVTVDRVFKQVPSGGAAQDVFTAGNARLTLACPGGDPIAQVVSQTNNSRILVRGTLGTTFGAADLDAGIGLNLSLPVFGGMVNFEFLSPDGTGATASLLFDDVSPASGETDCTVAGSVIAE
jgi:hypothetical protein